MIQTQPKNSSDFTLNFIDLLVQYNPGPCVSIIVGLHRESNERHQNLTLVRQAVLKAHAALNAFPCSISTRQLVTDRLDALAMCVNLDSPEGGIGLFVSPEVSTLVAFPFQVNEGVFVGNSFQTRDIVYLRQYLTPYYIVSLTSTSVRLFRAHADSMQELRDGGFPCDFEDDYEYSRSTFASSVGYGMKGFEKDKSIVSEIRGKSFVRDAAHHLNSRVPAGESDIVVCGPSRLVKEFADACSSRDREVTRVHGIHNASEFASLVDAAWKACQLTRKQRIERTIGEFEEMSLNFKAVGIRSVWAEVTRGNGLLLLVERDYERPAYIPNGVEEIRLHPPKGEYETIADAVDKVIEKVIRAGGKVIITETGQLRQFEHIGLMLRHK